MSEFTRPLDNFPLIRSRAIDDVCEAMARVYARPNLKIGRTGKTINARMNELALRDIQLGFGSYGSAIDLEYPAANSFVFLLPVRGHAELTTGNVSLSLTPGTSATVSADTGFKGRYDEGYEFLVLQVGRQALTRKLLTLTGATIDEPLRMDPRIIAGRSEARLLHEYLPVLTGTLTTADAPLPAWWVEQTEQLLMVMLLCSHRHNYSHLLEQPPRDPAPVQVRRAEEYIEADPERPLTLEDLAEVSGVSAFSLFRAFKKSRGYSPFEFAARLRAGRGNTQR